LQQGHARGPTAVSQLRATTKFMNKHTHMIAICVLGSLRGAKLIKTLMPFLNPFAVSVPNSILIFGHTLKSFVICTCSWQWAV